MNHSGQSKDLEYGEEQGERIQNEAENIDPPQCYEEGTKSLEAEISGAPNEKFESVMAGNLCQVESTSVSDTEKQAGTSHQPILNPTADQTVILPPQQSNQVKGFPAANNNADSYFQESNPSNLVTFENERSALENPERPRSTDDLIEADFQPGFISESYTSYTPSMRIPTHSLPEVRSNAVTLYHEANERNGNQDGTITKAKDLLKIRKANPKLGRRACTNTSIKQSPSAEETTKSTDLTLDDQPSTSSLHGQFDGCSQVCRGNASKQARKRKMLDDGPPHLNKKRTMGIRSTNSVYQCQSNTSLEEQQCENKAYPDAVPFDAMQFQACLLQLHPTTDESFCRSESATCSIFYPVSLAENDARIFVTFSPMDGRDEVQEVRIFYENFNAMLMLQEQDGLQPDPYVIEDQLIRPANALVTKAFY